MRYSPQIVYNHRALTAAPRSSHPAARSSPSIVVRRAPKRRVHRHGLVGHCKRLRLSRLAITVYNTYHMEWGFTLLERILTRQNRQAGGEGVRPGCTAETSTHSPPQIFLRQLAPFFLAHTRRHATFPYVLQDILPAVRSGWPSPLRRRKRSGLSSCPTSVAWPSLRVAACAHAVPLGTIDEFCGDLVERGPG